MTAAWVVRSDTEVTVHLPAETPLQMGEVEVQVEGDRIILIPSAKPYGLQLLELFERLGDLIEVPDDPPPEPVEGE
ncbi:MAG: hypothetical protein JWQ36_1029 [Enterovirga sp.]|nr:hypothetical protein [Enterovirga sp.]